MKILAFSLRFHRSCAFYTSEKSISTWKRWVLTKKSAFVFSHDSIIIQPPRYRILSQNVHAHHSNSVSKTGLLVGAWPWEKIWMCIPFMYLCYIVYMYVLCFFMIFIHIYMIWIYHNKYLECIIQACLVLNKWPWIVPFICAAKLPCSRHLEGDTRICQGAIFITLVMVVRSNRNIQLSVISRSEPQGIPLQKVDAKGNVHAFSIKARS